MTKFYSPDVPGKLNGRRESPNDCVGVRRQEPNGADGRRLLSGCKRRPFVGVPGFEPMLHSVPPCKKGLNDQLVGPVSQIM